MSKGLEALERLFKDIEYCSIDVARADLDDYKIIEKELKELEQYKAIEQELGIDLITLFKLVKSKKIYSFGHDNIMENSISGINIYDNTITIWNGYCHSNYPLSEYGKSFALTKEELKK